MLKRTNQQFKCLRREMSEDISSLLLSESGLSKVPKESITRLPRNGLSQHMYDPKGRAFWGS
jgi:hypothetical protein